jgi:hypothetical protein
MRLAMYVFAYTVSTDAPMSFQYICGTLYCAPPGPRKTEYGNEGW